MNVTINGHAIAVECRGNSDGAAMLLIHGLGGTGNYWTPAVLALGEKFNMVAPDLPGSGDSEIDPQATIESMMDDLLVLMDSLSMPRFHVAAHSMGTVIAQHIAARAPERVIDLVLLGALPEAPDPARKALQDRAALAESEGMVPIAEATATMGTAEATKREQPAAVAFVRESVLRQTPAGYARTCRALAEGSKAALDAIVCPTLLVSGTEDKTAPPPVAEALSAAITGSKLVLLPDCGHWTLTEKPLQVCKAMAEFYG